MLEDERNIENNNRVEVSSVRYEKLIGLDFDESIIRNVETETFANLSIRISGNWKYVSVIQNRGKEIF